MVYRYYNKADKQVDEWFPQIKSPQNQKTNQLLNSLSDLSTCQCTRPFKSSKIRAVVASGAWKIHIWKPTNGGNDGSDDFLSLGWSLVSKSQITFQEGNSTPCGINTLIHWSNSPSLFSNGKTARGVGDENEVRGGFKRRRHKAEPKPSSTMLRCFTLQPSERNLGKISGWKVDQIFFRRTGRTGVVYHLVMHVFFWW